MFYLGIDLGTSSVKLRVINAETGKSLCTIAKPDTEMLIEAPELGWAEQDPNLWWNAIVAGLSEIQNSGQFNLKNVKAIGIAYQMHGLVLTDENLNTTHNAIIWCDSRAIYTGNVTTAKLGEKYCEENILGYPGNFTASKLKWIKENRPKIYKRSKYAMLPGDFIAAKFTGIAQTTKSGLSEASLWNFSEQKLATRVLDTMGIDESMIPEIVPNFGFQAKINPIVANSLNLHTEVKITYRAGDQPNNAFSLNVINPGEVATTAGTSAVIYTVSDENVFDAEHRINTFLHVNDSIALKRNGVMLCVNGSGILYQWLRNLLSIQRKNKIGYNSLNHLASKSYPGSEGLRFYPFGNGAERIFQNQKAFSGIDNLNYNIHGPEHLTRSACEGIVFAMNYGFDIMKSLTATNKTIKAGNTNLFLSPVFREIFCNTTKTKLELYSTSGSEGAARGAAYGDGFYKSLGETFTNLELLETVEPTPGNIDIYSEIYRDWKDNLRIG